MKDIFLVDADDTILDFHGVSMTALKIAFEENGIAWEDRFATEYKLLNDSLWQALERKEITRDELMEKRFHYFLARLQIDGVDGDKFNKSYLNYLSTHPVYLEDAKEFLTKLNEMGRVYIVTNGTEWIQKSRFDIAGLWGYAEDVFISQRIGADKPEKAYTDYVKAHIEGFDEKHAVWIGDSLSADIKAANEGNITSIWFNPSKKPASDEIRPKYTVDNLLQILDVLKKISH